MISREMSYQLWLEFRLLRMDLAKQPYHLRETVMDYEERLLFMLIDDGVIEEILQSIRMNYKTLKAILAQNGRGDDDA